MNKLMIITTTATAVSVTAYALTMNSAYKDLYRRFPNFDHKIIRKAYNKFLMDAFKQNVTVADKTDRQMDLIFLTYITKVTL